MRIIALLFAASFFGLQLRAHEVIWWMDPESAQPVLDFYYPREFYDYITVAPSEGEPCIVAVNLDPPSSTLVNAQVLPPNPDNSVDIRVQVLRAPTAGDETATISGEWHATGFPIGKDCTAVIPNKFSVPVSVLNRVVLWKLALTEDRRWLKIDAGVDCALQASESLTGPWLNVGMGKTFKVSTEMPSGFYNRSRRLGGYVSGTVTDDSGKPLSGVTLGLLYGGPAASTSSKGAFSYSRLPWGMNLMSVTNPEGNASLNFVLSATENVTAIVRAAMAAAVAAATATNACNCTPWCAIGYGVLPGGQTPVYYAGGANPPKNAPADCGQPQVTVTTPGGVTSPITPGSAHHQNSGPNPASGTWTVTAVVCGQTKTCTITVP